MAATRYRTARLLIGASVAAGMISGTFYFANSAPAQAGTASQVDTGSSASVAAAPSAGSLRQVPAQKSPARRTRGS